MVTIADIGGQAFRGMQARKTLDVMDAERDLREAQTGKIQGERQRLSEIAGLRQRVAGGEGGALPQLAAVDPAEASKMLDVLTSSAEVTANWLDQIGREPVESRGAIVRQTIGGLPLNEVQKQAILEMSDDGFSDDEIAASRAGLAGMVQAAQDEFSSQFAGIDPETGEPGFFRMNEATGEAEPITGALPPPKSGEVIEVTNADGSTVRVSRGGAAAEDFSKPARTQLEKSRIDLGQTRSMLELLKQSFRPEFLEVGTRLENAWSMGMERLGRDLSETEQASVNDYVDAIANAGALMAAEINRLSGAAVSEAEAERLFTFIPNLGKPGLFGIFSGDSPSQAQRKIEQFIKRTNIAIARTNFFLRTKRPLTDAEFDKLPLEAFEERVIRVRGKEIQDELMRANPKSTAEDIQRQAARQLRNEFGL